MGSEAITTDRGCDCDQEEPAAAPDLRLKSVVGLAQDMAGALTPLEAVRAAAVRATEALGATMAAVSVWDRESGRLRVLVNHGELAPGEEELPEDESYPVADFPEIVTYLEERWTTGRLPRAWLQSAEDSEPHAGHLHPTAGAYCQERAAALRRRGRACCVVAPIVLHGQAWGELYLARTVGLPEFTEADADYATLLAAQISAGLAQTERLADLRKLAFSDPLTGLANRRAVDARLEGALEAHNRDNTVVSLVVCDVNGLKRVNDQLGHEMGDRLLERFAHQLSLAAAKLPGSLAARLGGDEFCLLVEGQKADEVVAVAEELCARALALAEGRGSPAGSPPRGTRSARSPPPTGCSGWPTPPSTGPRPPARPTRWSPGAATGPASRPIRPCCSPTPPTRTTGPTAAAVAAAGPAPATGGGSGAPRTAPTRASCSPRCSPRWTSTARRAPSTPPTPSASSPSSRRPRPGCWTRSAGGSRTSRRARS